MKKKFVFVSMLICVFCALWAVPALAAEKAEKNVTVFAAASMTEPMNKIAELYKATAPDVTIVYNFDSSGTLKTQIQEGAECDVFISAGQRQMDQIDITANPAVNTENLDFVLPGTRFDIVANQVVLIVPKGKNVNGISSFEDVMTDKVSIIALGNSDVPVGQYSQEIFTFMGVWEKLNAASKITFASNVKEVLVQVAAAAVECGVVYSTDAASSDGVEIVAPAPTGSHGPIIYPAAILSRTKDEATTKAFVNFLKGDTATGVFKDMGFAIPEK